MSGKMAATVFCLIFCAGIALTFSPLVPSFSLPGALLRVRPLRSSRELFGTHARYTPFQKV